MNAKRTGFLAIVLFDSAILTVSMTCTILVRMTEVNLSYIVNGAVLLSFGLGLSLFVVKPDSRRTISLFVPFLAPMQVSRAYSLWRAPRKTPRIAVEFVAGRRRTDEGQPVQRGGLEEENRRLKK